MTPPVVPLPPAFLARPIAHRALWGEGRPENSLSAVRAGVEAGYPLEFDLQPSADDEAMVFHDQDLDRLTDASGPISKREAAELVRIPLKGGNGEGIPRLSDLLAVVRGRVPLLIELKDQTGELATSKGHLEEATARALHGYEGPVAVMSFNPHMVTEMAGLRPDLPRGLTTDPFRSRDWPAIPDAVLTQFRLIRHYDETGSSFVSHKALDLWRPRVRRLRRRGAAILCWTIRARWQERLARRLADNVTFEGYRA
jgi:glycerophosphoryl diester phosphodiesterase